MKNFTLSLCAVLLLQLVSFGTQLSGTYTINPAGAATTTNFKNVASALIFMNGGSRTDGGPNNIAPFGISGPVVFNMTPGNYAESITVSITTGVSAINTITIQKLPASVGEVIFNTSVTSGLSIFNMNSQSGRYYAFRNLRFQPTVTSTSSTNSSMINNCIFLTIDNCIFDHANVAANNISDILSCNEVLVTNSTFFNSISTAKHQGGVFSSSFLISFNNNVVKNTSFGGFNLRTANFNNFQQSAIFISGNNTTASTFSDNILNNATVNVTGMSANLNLNIERNKINIDRQNFPDVFTNSNDAISHCISFSTAGSTGSTVRIANNFISINQNVLPAGTAGIFLASGQPYTVQVYHNTVSVNSTQQTIYPISGGTGIVKNNIFNNSGGGLAAINAIVNNWAFNNYYATVTPAYNGTDLNATTERVFFTSASDLHHSSGCLKGTPLGITTDIDGIAKNATTPVIGATEASNAGTDGGITRIVSPNIVYLQGPTLQTISFKLVNKGASTITSAQANYSINNGVPVSETFTGLNITSCDSATVSFTGQYNFPADRTILKIILTQVNGSADPNTLNDVVQNNVDILGPMSGIYTVNPAAAATPFNFIRIGEADSAMMARSIVGPVTIRIFNGTYSQTGITLNTVPGVSATNTIKFTSFSNDSLQVNINNVFQVINVPYVTLEKLRFTGSFVYTDPGIIRVSGSSNNITIKNCNIAGRIDYRGGNNFTFANNFLAGGIQINDGGGMPMINGVLLQNNTIAGGSSDGNATPFILQYFNVTKPVLDGNTFQDFNFNHVFGANAFKATFYFVGCSDTLFIKNNRFLRARTSRLVGDFNTTPTATTKLAHVEMFNNFITSAGQFNIGTSDLTNGVGVTQSMRFYFNNYHNIAATGGGFSFGSIGTSSGATGVTLNKNNNFVAKYNGIAAALSGINPAVTDNNNYFTNGPTLVSTSTNYATIGAYKAAGNEPNAISVNPKYIDSVNLHVQHPTLLAAGVPAPTVNPVLFDIDNDNRNSLNPAIGADEPNIPSNDVIVRQLLVAKKDFIASTSQQLNVRIQNNGGAILNQVKVRWTIDGVEQLPAYNWTGSLNYDSSTTINFGSYNFAMMKYTNLRVWTDLPNAAPDAVPINDTIRLDSIMPFARGQFTIGGVSPTLPSFTKAGEFLTYGGVDSAVNILIRNGKYTEQPLLKFARGAS
ncbi:MAG: hypothetical protein LH615_02770, partial [Ferruginibacter sp.]|nr:hypothetical protein [Ferruginibacter sp.]